MNILCFCPCPFIAKTGAETFEQTLKVYSDVPMQKNLALKRNFLLAKGKVFKRKYLMWSLIMILINWIHRMKAAIRTMATKEMICNPGMQ